MTNCWGGSKLPFEVLKSCSISLSYLQNISLLCLTKNNIDLLLLSQRKNISHSQKNNVRVEVMKMKKGKKHNIIVPLLVVEKIKLLSIPGHNYKLFNKYLTQHKDHHVAKMKTATKRLANVRQGRSNNPAINIFERQSSHSLKVQDQKHNNLLCLQSGTQTRSHLHNKTRLKMARVLTKLQSLDVF